MGEGLATDVRDCLLGFYRVKVVLPVDFRFLSLFEGLTPPLLIMDPHPIETVVRNIATIKRENTGKGWFF